MDTRSCLSVLLTTCYLSLSVSAQFTGFGQLDSLLEVQKQSAYQQTAWKALSDKYSQTSMTQLEFLSNTINSLLNTHNLTQSNLFSINSYEIQNGDRLIHEKIPPMKLKCLLDLKAFVTGVKDLKQWALQMMDAFGKPGTGILTGRITFPGYFEECHRVQASYGSHQQHSFKGRYCNARIALNLTADQLPNFPTVSYHEVPLDTIGLCLPDSCDAHDALHLLEIALGSQEMRKFARPNGAHCHEDVKLPISTVIVIIIIVFFVFLVSIATLVDIVLVQIPKWKRMDMANKTYIQESPYDHDLSDTSNEEVITLLGPLSRVDEYQPSPLVKLLLCFSAYTNGKKVWNTKVPKDALTCINGIRVLSMWWILLGHLCFFYLDIGVTDNLLYAFELYSKRWSGQVVANAFVGVDTFFVISGLLGSYITLGILKEKSGKMNWGIFYLHRYIRLTPLYMMVFAIQSTLVPYLPDGPYFPHHKLNDCTGNWWKNLLYLQNLISGGGKQQFCFGWSWYIADDFLFYVLSPLILVPLYRKPIVGYLISALFLLVTTTTPFILTFIYYFQPGFAKIDGYTQTGNWMFQYYQAPWCRMGPYIEGLVLGYILYRSKNKRINVHWILNIACWIAASAIGLIVVYGLYPYFNGSDIELWMAACYNSLSRVAWGLCVCWVIFSCLNGTEGGVVNSFLSLPVWVPLGRLTYSVYLIHPIILVVLSTSRRTPIYADDINISVLYCAVVIGCYGFGFLITLLFESPIMAIERIVFKRDK